MRDEKLFALLQAAASISACFQGQVSDAKMVNHARYCVGIAAALLAEIESRSRGAPAPEAEPERPAVPAGFALVSLEQLVAWARMIEIGAVDHCHQAYDPASGESCGCELELVIDECKAAVREARGGQP